MTKNAQRRRGTTQDTDGTREGARGPRPPGKRSGEGAPGGPLGGRELRFTGGVDISMKLPKAHYEATVDFYRYLGFELTDAEAPTPAVSRACSFTFGPNTLRLDCVDNYSQPDVWLELRTNDLDAATRMLVDGGIRPCDEVEPVEGTDARSHRIRNPAGLVHLLVEERGGA